MANTNERKCESPQPGEDIVTFLARQQAKKLDYNPSPEALEELARAEKVVAESLRYLRQVDAESADATRYTRFHG